MKLTKVPFVYPSPTCQSWLRNAVFPLLPIKHFRHEYNVFPTISRGRTSPYVPRESLTRITVITQFTILRKSNLNSWNYFFSNSCIWKKFFIYKKWKFQYKINYKSIARKRIIKSIASWQNETFAPKFIRKGFSNGNFISTFQHGGREARIYFVSSDFWFIAPSRGIRFELRL